MLAETRRREIAEPLRSTGAVTRRRGRGALRRVADDRAPRPRRARAPRASCAAPTAAPCCPTISAHEDSFARRLKVDADAKARLAEEAVALLAPRETVFLDSSTTSYFVARRIIETGIATTVLTNSLPVMELIFNEGGPDARDDRRRRQPAAAHALVRRPVRGADGPGPLRRPPLLSASRASTDNGHDDRRRRARGRGQAHDDRPGRRVDRCSSTSPSSRCAG